MPADLALANRAWESLLSAHSALLRQFAAEDVWRDRGLSMREYDVLYTLAKIERTGSIRGARIVDLVRDVLLSQPALSRLVDRLADRGLVDRVQDAEDRRAVRVRLSPEGRELQRAVGRAHARSVGLAVGSSLDGAEMRELARLTTALAERARGSSSSPADQADAVAGTSTLVG